MSEPTTSTGSTATSARPEVEAFVAQVRARLTDLSEDEREELAAAYREAETLRKQEEAKCQRLTAELAQVRHDYEKRLQQKEDELELKRARGEISCAECREPPP